MKWVLLKVDDFSGVPHQLAYRWPCYRDGHLHRAFVSIEEWITADSVADMIDAMLEYGSPTAEQARRDEAEHGLSSD